MYTKDVSNAGTDANVHLMLCGRRGDSGIRKMLYSQTEGNKFESGMVSDMGYLFSVLNLFDHQGKYI